MYRESRGVLSGFGRHPDACPGSGQNPDSSTARQSVNPAARQPDSDRHLARGRCHRVPSGTSYTAAIDTWRAVGATRVPSGTSYTAAIDTPRVHFASALSTGGLGAGGGLGGGWRPRWRVSASVSVVASVSASVSVAASVAGVGLGGGGGLGVGLGGGGGLGLSVSSGSDARTAGCSSRVPCCTGSRRAGSARAGSLVAGARPPAAASSMAHRQRIEEIASEGHGLRPVVVLRPDAEPRATRAATAGDRARFIPARVTALPLGAAKRRRRHRCAMPRAMASNASVSTGS